MHVWHRERRERARDGLLVPWTPCRAAASGRAEHARAAQTIGGGLNLAFNQKLQALGAPMTALTSIGMDRSAGSLLPNGLTARPPLPHALILTLHLDKLTLRRKKHAVARSAVSGPPPGL